MSDNIVALPKMIRAKFTYFTKKGKFQLSANGVIREGWSTQSNTPKLRRTQIMQDNRGTMPGMTGRASEYFIHIEAQDARLLVLPEITV